MKKKFDCVAMKRRGAEVIYSEIANMTTAEQLAYWQERTRAMRQRQKSNRPAKAMAKRIKKLVRSTYSLPRTRISARSR